MTRHTSPLRTGAVALMSAATTAVLLVPAPASAADQVYRVPRQAWITITGHGYGHGHGLSQHGAEGAARAGLTAQQIVDFYYPGTEPGRKTGPVRVRISADADNDTTVLPRPDLQVRDLRTRERWVLPDNGTTRWRLGVGSGGRSEVRFRTSGGTWKRWRVLTGDGAFAAKGRPITLVTPAGQVAYRGSLESRRPSSASTQRHTVNALRLDSYLKGVVPREMPASWSPAAVQAQAIAARTYAAWEMTEPLTDTYDICDTTSCQVYGGRSAEHPDSNAAVVATSGMIQTYDGRPAFTQFSASSGGWTSAGSVPYLVEQEDPYDDWAGNTVHTWSVRIDATRIEKAWPRLGNLRAIVVKSREGYGDWGGRIVTMVLDGGRDDVTVSGSTFRSALGLRSQWVTFKAVAK